MTSRTRHPASTENGSNLEQPPADPAPSDNGEGEERAPPPLSQYPLKELLQEVLQQEKVLWRRNEVLQQSLRVAPAANQAGQESGTNRDSRSATTAATITATSAMPTPTPEEVPEGDQSDLYLIRYGRLTNVIHRYFRRLEKRHACLYLTSRKAKHENLRHLDTNSTPNHEEELPIEVQSAALYANEGGRQLAILRDEELLVYRCALMCSQFPMLSAPNPPDGHSPTPTFPTPFATLGSPRLARTAPAEFISTAAASGITVEPRAKPRPLRPPQHQGSPKGSPKHSRRASQRGKTADGTGANGAHPPTTRTSSGERTRSKPQDKRGSSESPEVKRKNQARPSLSEDGPELESLWPSGPKPPTSEPIPIKAGVHSTRKKNGVGAAVPLDETGGRKWTSTDSDEDEIVELMANKPPAISKNSSSDPLSREHPFPPMVNREMLCNLVRRAFKQTEEQQLQFEQILRHEYGRRSKGEILAKELVGQLQVLENNAHPFYKPKLFVTRNGYDQWLQAEKQRVRSLIDKFWHFSLPRPQLWRHYNPTDYHRAYGILLQKIVCCESRTERKEPVHSGRTPSGPLSPTAQRLLTEFGLRYGVGELYRQIVYLDYLARHFDYEIWYIKHCTEELRGTRKLLPRNRNKITAVRREMELLRSTVHLLHGQADNSLTRIDRLFLDSDPKEGVAILIEMLSEVLDAEQSLFGKKVRPAEDWLKRYLKSGFVLRYERRKEIASDETLHTRTVQPFVLTPALVNALLLSIRDEVQTYRESFQPVFRPYFDIVPFSKVEFYRLLCADACSLCARIIHRPETRQSLSLEMLGLMYRLNERDLEWASVIPPELQLWRQHFVDLALIWMDVLARQINQWIVQAVAQDQWALLTFSIHHTDGSPTPALPQNLGVTSGIRQSPFPSPPISSREPSKITSSILGTTGAFTPYRRAVLTRYVEKSLHTPASEGSGAITDMSSNATSSASSLDSAGVGNAGVAIEEIPEIVLKGAKIGRGKGSDDSSSMLNFGQSDTPGGKRNPRDVNFSTMEPAREIEVSVSVYDSYEPYPQPSPSQTSPTATSPVGAPRKPEGLEEEGTGTVHVDRSMLNGEAAVSEEVGRSDSQSLPPEAVSPVSAVPEAQTSQTVNRLPKRDAEFKLLLESHELDTGVIPKDARPSSPPVDSHTSVEHSDRTIVAKSQETIPNGPIDVNVCVLSPDEYTALTGLPSGIAVVKRSNAEPGTNSHLLPGKAAEASAVLSSISTDNNPSLSIEVTDPKLSITGMATRPGVRFGNILDSCADPVRRDELTTGGTHERAGGSNWKMPSWEHSTGTDEYHIPPASVGTVPKLAEWRKEHQGAPLTKDTSSSTPTDESSDVSSQDTLKKISSLEVRSDTNGVGSGSQEVAEGTPKSQEVRSYLFPVSNSPLDIITMLTRAASFTGVLLNILTPKLRQNVYHMADQKAQASHEYSSEISMARQQAVQQLRLAEEMKNEFLKKLHKMMVNCLKLYADNLLCMDLCCWSGNNAMRLIGDQMVHHLRRRKDAGDIWGCRHMVEARHGLHPHGIPCQKKSSSAFESITRDMCIRINNIHTLLTIFTSLELHLYSSTRTEVLRPISAFGYISSDQGDLSPHRGLLLNHTHRPNSYRPRPPKNSSPDMGLFGVGNQLHPPGGSSSWPSSLSMGLGPMEPDEGDRTARERPEVGFRSRDSQQVVQYLQSIQRFQLKLLCSRMNKFFQPALTLLLELKLGECPIEKRLYPLITFLSRHRSALQKYIYPECYSATMEFMWDCIVQDLEEEAVKLRSSKKPVTIQAHLLLQALSHLISFMHDKGNGLSLDLLTPSSEYLLSLLDIMTRSTDQLISIFNKLSTPQFARSRLDMSRAPVVVDTEVLHALRTRLHTYKKCFSGKEFVDRIVEMGRQGETHSGAGSLGSSPIPEPQGQGSRLQRGRLTTQVISPTGQPIVYTVHYAKEVAQYLLNERILLPLPDISDAGEITPLGLSSEDEGGRMTGERESSLSIDRARAVDASRSLQVAGGSSVSPHLSPIRTRPFGMGTTSRNFERDAAAIPVFSYSSQVLYKFADAEDVENGPLYQSQILSASVHHQQNSNDGDETIEFHRARYGTLFLVYDLLLQRVRKDRVAKQFLQSPRALTVAEQRRQLDINCDQVFKM